MPDNENDTLPTSLSKQASVHGQLLESVHAELVWDKDDALRRLRNRADRLHILLGMFLDSLHDKAPRLEEAASALLQASANEQAVLLESIEKRAHSLRGAALNIGANQVAALALALERYAKEGEVTQVIALHPNLHMAINTTEALLSEYYAANKPESTH